jgi:hypothetical protein
LLGELDGIGVSLWAGEGIALVLVLACNLCSLVGTVGGRETSIGMVFGFGTIIADEMICALGRHVDDWIEYGSSCKASFRSLLGSSRVFNCWFWVRRGRRRRCRKRLKSIWWELRGYGGRDMFERVWGEMWWSRCRGAGRSLQRFEVALDGATLGFLDSRRKIDRRRLFNASFLAWRLFWVLVDALWVGLECRWPGKIVVNLRKLTFSLTVNTNLPLPEDGAMMR